MLYILLYYIILFIHYSNAFVMNNSARELVDDSLNDGEDKRGMKLITTIQ